MNAEHENSVRGQSVVLDIGNDVGALVIYASPELAGVEIEIWVHGADQPITHTEIHPRRLPGGDVLAGVFPELIAGEYVLRPPPGTTGIDVKIEGGRVAVLDWR